MTNTVLGPFGTTIFAEMTALAQRTQAINLAQGFPDFEGPELLKEAAIEALMSGHNQYARSRGSLRLVSALSQRRHQDQGTLYDSATEIVVTSGATEAIAAALLGLLEEGDEVITFEPFYDSYPACVALGRGRLVPVTLNFPEFAIDRAALDAALSPRSRVLLLNFPHNPTGRVLRDDELEVLVDFVKTNDLIVISDEVYEHITFERPHRSIAQCEGMRERCLVISSAGKTLSYTGWKIGWAMGPPNLIDALQAAHQFTTFSTATPLQEAVAVAFEVLGDDFYSALRNDYRNRRDQLCKVLRDAGFQVPPPEGSYFVLASFDGLFDGDDRAFARFMAEEVGVAVIPPSPFYRRNLEEARSLARFAFCKKDATLNAAADRLTARLTS